jgi:hypothetical protein
MTTVRTLASTLLLAALAGCSATIADLNSHPTKHYQSDVTVTGQVTRLQTVGDEVLIEIADARDKRILLRAKAPTDLKPTDWVKAHGLFVPEAKIGQQIVYDAVLAEDIQPAKPPTFRNLF